MSPGGPGDPADDARRLDDSLRSAPVVDRDGYSYLVHPLTDGVPRCPPELLRAFVAWAAGQDLLAGATLLVAPEAMALPLAAALGLETDLPYVVVRKRPYGLAGERAAAARTGYGEATLHLNDVHPGDRVVVVDDVLSTGATTDALMGAMDAAGAEVAGVLVFLDKGGRRGALEAHHGVPVRAMRQVRVDADQVHVVAEP